MYFWCEAKFKNLSRHSMAVARLHGPPAQSIIKNNFEYFSIMHGKSILVSINWEEKQHDEKHNMLTVKAYCINALLSTRRPGICAAFLRHHVINGVKGSVERSRHERHFFSLLSYFLLSWLQIFQLCLSFWTSSVDLVLFLKNPSGKRKITKKPPKTP